MQIISDRNQFTGSHAKSNKRKHDLLEYYTGEKIIVIPMAFGDYTKVTPELLETIKRRGDKLKKADTAPDIKVSVDFKLGLNEVAMNICSGSHDRFRDECILAQKHGCKLYILVQEENVKSIDDVFRWVNPRNKNWYFQKKKAEQQGLKIPKQPPKGETIAKAILTMQLKYAPLEFVFANEKDVPKKIIELLEGKETV